MIQGVTDIRRAYADQEVARTYIEQRFQDPLGALLHARQAAALRRLVAAPGVCKVLEIAPGPGRLTTEVAAAFPGRGFVVEASPEMLHEAQRRLSREPETRWHCINGDAFQLPLHAAFDFVYVFRLIRHFGLADRARLYAQIARVLRPGGVLAFDAVNEVVSAPLRQRRPGEFRHYDALMRPEHVRTELTAAGFQHVQLEGVQHRYRLLSALQVLVAPRSRAVARAMMEAVDRVGGGEPLEWIVTCRRA